MSNYYKRVIEIYKNGFDAESIALHYAQNYPKAFCDAYSDSGQEEKHVRECRDMMLRGGIGMKVEAIKRWRIATGASLKEAKEAVEGLL